MKARGMCWSIGFGLKTGLSLLQLRRWFLSAGLYGDIELARSGKHGL